MNRKQRRAWHNSPSPHPGIKNSRMFRIMRSKALEMPDNALKGNNTAIFSFHPITPQLLRHPTLVEFSAETSRKGHECICCDAPIRVTDRQAAVVLIYTIGIPHFTDRRELAIDRFDRIQTAVTLICDDCVVRHDCDMQEVAIEAKAKFERVAFKTDPSARR